MCVRVCVCVCACVRVWMCGCAGFPRPRCSGFTMHAPQETRPQISQVCVAAFRLGTTPTVSLQHPLQQSKHRSFCFVLDNVCLEPTRTHSLTLSRTGIQCVRGVSGSRPRTNFLSWETKDGPARGRARVLHYSSHSVRNNNNNTNNNNSSSSSSSSNNNNNTNNNNNNKKAAALGSRAAYNAFKGLWVEEANSERIPDVNTLRPEPTGK